MSETIPAFDRIGEDLAQCGWSRVDGDGPGVLLLQAGRGSVRVESRLFEVESGRRLLAMDFGDFALSPREELFPRFLDFSIEARMALAVAALTEGVELLVLVADGAADLYRLPTEHLEQTASSRAEYDEEFLPSLAAKARRKPGDLDSVPSSMEPAQALRGWLAHWSRQLAGRLDVGPEDCERFIWKFILMLQFSRKIHGSEIGESWGFASEKVGDAWTLGYDAVQTHEDFCRLLDEFDQTFSSRIFSGDAEMHAGWLSKLEPTALIEQMRAELLMQSQLKFEAESVAWLYTRVESEQAGWRREVAGLAPIRKRIAARNWAVLKPLQCDVAEHGLTAALREIDRLAAHWRDQDVYARQRSQAAGPAERFYSQPDLFKNSPRGVSPIGRLDDGVNFIFGESLRLTGVETADRFGVGIVLLLKALGLAREQEWPFFGVDTLDSVWPD